MPFAKLDAEKKILSALMAEFGVFMTSGPYSNDEVSHYVLVMLWVVSPLGVL